MKLVFATQNENKLKEVQAMMPDGIELRSLADMGHTAELEETATTIEGNARQKAEFIYRTYSLSCFADDTGLEVDALGGAPGVYSARYAGDDRNSQANMMKVLSDLGEAGNRKARFRTVITLYLEDGQSLDFEGIVEGRILHQPAGEAGFGYDPIFVPEGDNRSFAEMTREEKGAVSHRGRAVQKLAAFFNQRFREQKK